MDDESARQAALSRNPQVVDCGLAEGELLLLHLESGAYHELNPIGAAIWELIDGARTTSEIADGVRDRLDDPPDDLERVVEGFLEDLRARDLIG